MYWNAYRDPGEVLAFNCEDELKNLESTPLVFESMTPVIIKDQFSRGVGGLLWEGLWLLVNSRFSFYLYLIAFNYKTH